MTNIANITWNSFYHFSVRMILGRQMEILRNQFTMEIILWTNFNLTWLGRILILRKKSIFYQDLSITIATMVKIVICGFWNPLDWIEGEALKYLTLLKLSRKCLCLFWTRCKEKNSLKQTRNNSKIMEKRRIKSKSKALRNKISKKIHHNSIQSETCRTLYAWLIKTKTLIRIKM